MFLFSDVLVFEGIIFGMVFSLVFWSKFLGGGKGREELEFVFRGRSRVVLYRILCSYEEEEEELVEFGGC